MREEHSAPVTLVDSLKNQGSELDPVLGRGPVANLVLRLTTNLCIEACL